MIGNILILVVVIALVLLFGWLTYRAVRAKKLWVKIVGGLLAGLLTLVLAAMALFGGKGIATVYKPDVPAALALTVAGSPEQVARGEYLVNLSCIGCHGAEPPQPSGRQQFPFCPGWPVKRPPEPQRFLLGVGAVYGPRFRHDAGWQRGCLHLRSTRGQLV